jgi:hypothetical protein
LAYELASIDFYAGASFYSRCECTVAQKFRLSARVSSDNPSTIKPVLERILGKQGTIKPIEDGFEVNVELYGESARDLNRSLLTEMRKVEKKTRLRAEWTLGDTTEKFFDYVPKGTRKLKQM